MPYRLLGWLIGTELWYRSRDICFVRTGRVIPNPTNRTPLLKDINFLKEFLGEKISTMLVSRTILHEIGEGHQSRTPHILGCGKTRWSSADDSYAANLIQNTHVQLFSDRMGTDGRLGWRRGLSSEYQQMRLLSIQNLDKSWR